MLDINLTATCSAHTPPPLALDPSHISYAEPLLAPDEPGYVNAQSENGDEMIASTEHRTTSDELPSGGLLLGTDRVTGSSGGTHDHIYPATGRPNARIELTGPPRSTPRSPPPGMPSGNGSPTRSTSGVTSYWTSTLAKSRSAECAMRRPPVRPPLSGWRSDKGTALDNALCGDADWHGD